LTPNHMITLGKFEENGGGEGIVFLGDLIAN